MALTERQAPIRPVERFGATRWRSRARGPARPTPPIAGGSLVENLRRLGEVADGRSAIDLAHGNAQAGPTQNADAMLALMAEVDHPRVRLNFDTGNIAYYNRWGRPGRRAGPGQASGSGASTSRTTGEGSRTGTSPPSATAAPSTSAGSARVLDGVRLRSVPYTIEIEGIGGEPEPGPEVRQERVERSVEPPSRPRLFRATIERLEGPAQPLPRASTMHFPRSRSRLRSPRCRQPRRSAPGGRLSIPLGELKAGAKPAGSRSAMVGSDRRPRPGPGHP